LRRYSVFSPFLVAEPKTGKTCSPFFSFSLPSIRPSSPFLASGALNEKEDNPSPLLEKCLFCAPSLFAGTYFFYAAAIEQRGRTGFFPFIRVCVSLGLSLFRAWGSDGDGPGLVFSPCLFPLQDHEQLDVLAEAFFFSSGGRGLW